MSTDSISNGPKTEANEQYIFRDAEFEDENFHAATFVTQYRRVSYSLESLKEQLLLYSEALKQELFLIINRDYKDFITITTKLDGLDTRLEFMKTPLIDLRTHLTSLHEAVLSSIQSMQDKMRLRVEVSNRRKMIENFLMCLDTIETTKSVLGGVYTANLSAPGASDTNTSLTTSTKRDKLRRLVVKKATIDGGSEQGISPPPSSTAGPSPFSPLSSILDGDLFACSEYERAAHSLRGVQRCLLVLSSLNLPGGEMSSRNRNKTAARERASSSVGTSSKLSWSDRRVQQLHRTIETQSAALSEQLVKKLTAQLQNIFTSAVYAVPSDQSTTSANSTSGSGSGGTQSLSKTQRQIAHCLRALITLRQGHEAEKVLRSTVIDPFIKPLLTQGKIDGERGRGSYSGLHGSLCIIVDAVQRNLKPLLSIAEDVLEHSVFTQSPDATDGRSSKVTGTDQDMAGAGAGVDLIINSILVPVMQLLSQRFPMMCSIGIPNILSACYRAVEQFKQSLAIVVQSEKSATVAKRMACHPSVCAFSSQWKLDIYLQLRRNEIFVRLDKASDFALKSATKKGSRGSLLDYLYQSESIKASSGSGGSSGDSAANCGVGESKLDDKADKPHSSTSGEAAVAQTLLTTELEAVTDTITKDLVALAAISGVASFEAPIYFVFAVESMTCLHESVSLRPITDQFLAILLRIFVRLEAHVAVLCSITTPSFDKAALEAMRNFASSPTSTPAVKSRGAVTPSKGVASAAIAGGCTAGGDITSLGGLPATTLQDLVMTTRDMLLFRHWVTGPLAKRSIEMVLSSQAEIAGDRSSRDSIVAAIERCFTSVTERLATAQTAVWDRTATLLTTECRKGLLSAVKAIAGRYRMTNKPPPDSPSPYVESTLRPLRDMMKTHQEYLNALDDNWRFQWQLHVVEAVTLTFCEQVRLLMETVRQMDSALLRRSKMRTTAAASSNTGMGDSQKISLQLTLDVEAYGAQVKGFGINPTDLPSYVELTALITPSASEDATEQK